MDRKSRTVLCLGPPHSGKSVFSYILFKNLRKLGNDACLMDCDYYSPTLRRRADEIADQDDNIHIYTTPYARKMDINEDTYSRLCQTIFDTIVEEGVIVLDGIGRHTSSTKVLLTLTDKLIVLSASSFNVEIDGEKCYYVKEEKAVHPFDFYAAASDKCIKITTYCRKEERSSFEPKTMQGELFDLDWNLIHRGNIEKIPERTRKMIARISQFILEEWI